MKLNNLTKEQKRKIANCICRAEPGFEGHMTFSECGGCIVCLCRKEVQKRR